MADWVTIKDAAKMLGVSQDTVKRRLRAGQIVGRRESTTKGFRWLIELRDGVAAPPIAQAQATSPASAAPAYARADASGGAPDDEASELAHVQELLSEVRQQRDDYAAQVSVKDTQIAELHILLQRALERQPMLELPVSMGTAVPTQQEAPPPGRKRRWWQWLVWGN